MSVKKQQGDAGNKKRRGYKSADRKKYSALDAELRRHKTDSVILTLCNSSMESIAKIVYARLSLQQTSIQTDHRKFLQRVIPAALVYAVKVKTKSSHQHVMVATTGLEIDRATLQKSTCLKFRFKCLDAIQGGLVTAEEVADQIPFSLKVDRWHYSAGMQTSYPDMYAPKKSLQHTTDTIMLKYTAEKPPVTGMPIKCIACCPYTLMPNYDELQKTPVAEDPREQLIYSFNGLEVVFTIVVCATKLEEVPFGSYVQQLIPQPALSRKQLTPPQDMSSQQVIPPQDMSIYWLAPQQSLSSWQSTPPQATPRQQLCQQQGTLSQQFTPQYSMSSQQFTLQFSMPSCQFSPSQGSDSMGANCDLNLLAKERLELQDGGSKVRYDDRNEPYVDPSESPSRKGKQTMGLSFGQHDQDDKYDVLDLLYKIQDDPFNDILDGLGYCACTHNQDTIRTGNTTYDCTDCQSL